MFSVLKYKHLYAEYFDLGIMHQTVYNSYMAIKTGDMSRLLELTTPHGGIAQIKRMAIHNDIILAFLAPFYFIHTGPETILVLQSVVLALGAWAVYKISILRNKNKFISVAFAATYLLYFPMQRANIFEFHAVTFATSFILFMYYFWLTGKKRLTLLFLALALFTKEEVGLTLGMFGVYLAFIELLKIKSKSFIGRNFFYALLITAISWGWSLFSVYGIIPYFNGGEHFATGYYNSLHDTFYSSIFSKDTADYLYYLLGPISFLPLLAPEFLLIALPEFGINLLSSNLQLRSLIFHYTSVLQPWLFIGAIYGASRILKIKINLVPYILGVLLIGCTVWFSYTKSPLPYSQEKNIDALLYDRRGEYDFVTMWQKQLQSDSLIVSATDQIAPFFTSRRKFYIFSHDYKYADYVIVSLGNIQYTYRKDVTIPAYDELRQDLHFSKVDEGYGYEVYKKILR